MRLAFLGNGGFGLPTLRVLAQGPYPVEAVVTRPDRPSGRGRRPTSTPVSSAAAELDLPVVAVEDLKDPATADLLTGIGADLWVVVAFPILPAGLIGIPPEGIVNLHASLLPRYRGAAPIQWALINGEEITGVTTFFIDTGVDTGAICLQREVAIPKGADAAALADLLSQAGAELIAETVDLVARGEAPRTRQEPALAIPAPRLTKQDGLLDWDLPARTLWYRVRGLSPWPGAYTFFGGERLVVGACRPAEVSELAWDPYHPPPPGTIAGFLPDGTPVAACGDGQGLILERLQREGRRMSGGADIARGLRWEGAERLTGHREEGRG